MSWAIVRKGFDEPLLFLEGSFATLDIPAQYRSEEYQLMPC